MVREYSLEMASRPSIWALRYSMSDSSIMIGRPLPSPWYGSEVRDGHAMTM